MLFLLTHILCIEGELFLFFEDGDGKLPTAGFWTGGSGCWNAVRGIRVLFCVFFVNFPLVEEASKSPYQLSARKVDGLMIPKQTTNRSTEQRHCDNRPYPDFQGALTGLLGFHSKKRGGEGERYVKVSFLSSSACFLGLLGFEEHSVVQDDISTCRASFGQTDAPSMEIIEVFQQAFCSCFWFLPEICIGGPWVRNGALVAWSCQCSHSI